MSPFYVQGDDVKKDANKRTAADQVECDRPAVGFVNPVATGVQEPGQDFPVLGDIIDNKRVGLGKPSNQHT